MTSVGTLFSCPPSMCSSPLSSTTGGHSPGALALARIHRAAGPSRCTASRNRLRFTVVQKNGSTKSSMASDPNVSSKMWRARRPDDTDTVGTVRSNRSHRLVHSRSS